MFTILKQTDFPYMETMVAAQVAAVKDIPLLSSSLAGLDSFADVLPTRLVLPVGSVEFVRKAMRLGGFTEPEWDTYPEALQPFLHREIRKIKAGSVLGHWFVKPVRTKSFTGFVYDPLQDTATLNPHDAEQYEVFQSLPAAEEVYIAEPVDFLSEHRFYVCNGQILGSARYDPNEDGNPEPEMPVVLDMVQTFCATPQAPIAFGIDIGVLSTGKTALVEVNDAWALGFYKGSIGYEAYINTLWERWQQICNCP